MRTEDASPKSAPQRDQTADFLTQWGDAVRIYRDELAICDESTSYTYAELDAVSDKIAAALVRHGIAAEKLVLLQFDRPIDHVLGVISTLKAGGAFVIGEATVPAGVSRSGQRVAQAALRLFRSGTRSKLQIAVDVPSLDVASVVASDFSGDAQGTPGWPERLLAPRQLAYILFTSGSTGRPKGVMVERRNLGAFVGAVRARLDLAPNDRWLQLAPPTFDVFLEETLPILTAGGVVLCKPDHSALDFATLHDMLARTQSTVVEMSTQYWYAYRRWLDAVRCDPPPELRLLIVGGEKMDVSAYRDWQTRRQTPLIHVYGITETTVTSCMFDGDVSPDSREVPIGNPLANSELAVLDQDMATQVGIEAGIYIGGAAVGRGYFDNPALTAERFVPDPAGTPGSRMYRSGDLGVMTEGGDLIFRGRLDDEVKLGGRRFNLGEIATALSAAECVDQAVALCAPSGRSSLVAIVTLSVDERGRDAPRLRPVSEPCRAAIIAALNDHFPGWTIPVRIVAIQQFPTTAQGKVDRDHLAELLTRSTEAPVAQSPFLDIPQGPLLDAFRTAIGSDDLSWDDDFFDFGGDSLGALMIVSAAEEYYGVDVCVDAVFDAPTARELTRRVEAKAQAKGNDSGVA